MSPSLWQILSTSHIPECLSSAFTVHSSSPANTFSVEPDNVCTPSASKHPSVQLECCFYKRHPSASLEWFLFAVHLSSVCHSVFTDSLCLSAANFGSPNKTWKTLELKWHDCFPLKCNQAFDEFLFSILLPFPRVANICCYEWIPGSKII